MKAIVSVRKTSSQAKNNGLTFEVAEILSRHVALLIPSNELGKDVTTDFSFTEVIIIDIQEECQRAYDNRNWDSSKYKEYECLKTYCNVNRIIFSPTFNCPA